MFGSITFKRFLVILYFGIQLVWDLFTILFVLLSHAPLLVIPVEIFVAAIGGFIGIGILKKVFPLFYGTTMFKSEETDITDKQKQGGRKNHD